MAIDLPGPSTTGIAQNKQATSVSHNNKTGRKRKVAELQPAERPSPNSAFANQFREPQQQAANGWEFLRHWETTGDDTIVEFSEEEEPNNDESDESDQGDAPRIPERTLLTKDRRTEIVNEEIERYTSKWKPNKGVPIREHEKFDHETLWGNVRTSGQREEKVQQYEAEVEKFRDLLEERCDTIVNQPENSAATMRRVCGNLEQTINNLERAKYLLDIYKNPPRSDSGQEELHSRSPTLQPIPPEHDNGQEELHIRTPSTQRIPSESDNMQEELHCRSPSVESESASPPRRLSNHDLPVITSPACELPVPTPARRLRSTAIQRHSSPNPGIVETILGSLTMPTPMPRVETAPMLAVPQSQVQFDDMPQLASMVTIRRWKWADLVDTKDRKRVVSKAVYEMTPEARETIRARLNDVDKQHLLRDIHACIVMLCCGEASIPGVDNGDLPKIKALTRLFLCWWLCNNYVLREPSREELHGLLEDILEDDSDLGIFYDYLRTIMMTTFSAEALQHPNRPSQYETIDISSDEYEPPLGSQTKAVGSTPEKPISL